MAKDVLELKEGNYTFQLLQKITPRIQGETPYQSKLALAPTCLSYDPATKKARIIRHVPGLASHWKDEQKDVTEKFADEQAWRPEFIKGVLTLEHPRDEAKIRFMLERDEFDGKEIRQSRANPVYTLVNKEVEFQDDIEFMKAKHKAEGIAMEANEEDMTQHAVYLGVSLISGIDKKKPVELRKEYIAKATSNPKLFLKTYDSPAMKVESQVKQALQKGLFDLGHVKGEARWADTKAMIVALDPKEETAKQITDFAISKAGDAFRKRLTDALKKA